MIIAAMINHFLFVTWLIIESARIIDGSSTEYRFSDVPRRNAAPWRRTEMSADRTLQGIDYGLDVPSVTTERNHHPNNVPVIRYPAGSQRDDESNDGDSTLTMDVENGEFPNYNPDLVAASEKQMIDAEADSQQQYDSSDSAHTSQFADAEDNEESERNSKQQLDPNERSRRYGYVDTTDIQDSRQIPKENSDETFYPYNRRSVMTKDIRSPYKLQYKNSGHLDPFEQSRRYGYVDPTDIQDSRMIPKENSGQKFYPYGRVYAGRSVMPEDIESPYKLHYKNSGQQSLPPVSYYRTNYSADDSHSGFIDGKTVGGASHANLGQSIVPVSKSREQKADNDHDGSRPRASKKRRVMGRRYFLEPLIDGAILGTLGALFSDEIRKEANKDRIEREKAYEQELLDKYTKIFNDPVELAKLAREAAKSPTYINQLIRRSFPQLSPSFYEKYRANLSSPNHVAANLTAANERTTTKQREYSPRTFYKNHVNPHQRRLVVDSNRFRYRNKSSPAYSFPVGRT